MSELLKYPGDSEIVHMTPEGKAAAHTRRVFLFKLAVAMNAVVGVVLAVPLLGYVLGPALKKGSKVGSWISLGGVDSFPIGQTTLVDFVSPVKSLDDGETAKIPCWVRRQSQDQFQVFAINCAHLGCPVRWFAQSQLFMCPCHGGAYYANGERAAGPPERGLFEYESKVVNGALVIHAGNMPTLATQAKCTQKPLVQIVPAAESAATGESSEIAGANAWQA
jgi:menaquinol-cytochrome c reductase iron-sulfur subunit